MDILEHQSVVIPAGLLPLTMLCAGQKLTTLEQSHLVKPRHASMKLFTMVNAKLSLIDVKGTTVCDLLPNYFKSMHCVSKVCTV